MSQGLGEEIKKRLLLLCEGEDLRFDEPMRKHTSFRVGGEADAWIGWRDLSHAKELLSFLEKERIPYFITGNGTNLLVSDQGYRGVILCTAGQREPVRVVENRILAPAGASLARIAEEALRASLTGLEGAAGIPGSLGGALCMNAGAYDFEMKDVTEQVTALRMDTPASPGPSEEEAEKKDEEKDRGRDRAEGGVKEGEGAPAGKVEQVQLSGSEMEFGYRSSIAGKQKIFFLSARLKLTPGNPEEIRARMEELSLRRKQKQPLEFASAGSTFKRPRGSFAGKLIEEAGLRGFRIGEAQVSEKHCGFVINRGGASASEIMQVILAVTERVEEKTGIRLETEVIPLGF